MIVSANMATFPSREKISIMCLDNLLQIPSINIIRVYLNEYSEIPNGFPKDRRLLYLLGGEDLKDSGKFYWAGTFKDEYYFSIDDDLIYPEEYFTEHVKLLNEFNNEIFVTLHGKIMKTKPRHFSDNISKYHYLREVSENVWVNNPGTGVLAFDNSKFIIPIDMFKYHGMADLWISYYCQLNKIPIICRKHSQNHLIYHKNLVKDSLFEKRRELRSDHNDILKMIGDWVLYKNTEHNE
jgi:hypothetical protein